VACFSHNCSMELLLLLLLYKTWQFKVENDNFTLFAEVFFFINFFYINFLY
jgi:hypothetical protein